MNSYTNIGTFTSRAREQGQLYSLFDDTPFRFSYVDNKIFLVGCNAIIYIIGVSNGIPAPATTGCTSTCPAGEEPRNGSCSGAGCCEADLLNDLGSYYAYFNQQKESSRTRRRDDPCSYVAVMEKAAFNYSTGYLSSTAAFWDAYGGRIPVVMDWAFRTATCEAAAANNSSSDADAYACVSDDSDCVDSTNGQGYRCKCKDGYQGNPYLKGGCEDIDECHDSATDPCVAGDLSKYTGSFTCSCPPGKEMINGVCKAKQKSSSWVMPVVGASVGAVALVIAIAYPYLFRERRKL